MDPLIGVFHTLLFVLLLSGIDKIVRPGPAAEALRTAHLAPGSPPQRIGRSRLLARLLGVVELATAVVVAAGPRPGSATLFGAVWVGVVFAGFAWFVSRLRAIDVTAGCGCFGASSAPPGPAHRWANLAAATVALTTAVVATLTETGIGVASVLERGPVVWSPYLATVAGAALLFLLAPSLLADLGAARFGDPDPAHRAKSFAIDREWRR